MTARSSIQAQEVISVGLAVLDYLFVVRSGGRGNMGYIERYSIQGGGWAATAAVASSRLGLRTSHWGWVGTDDVGERVIAGLEEERVSTKNLVRVRNGKTNVALVRVDSESGERQIDFFPGLGLPAKLPRFPWQEIRKARAILMDPWWLALSTRVAQVAKEAGVPVIGDMSPDEELAELLSYVDVLFAPRPSGLENATARTVGPALERMHEYGPKVVGITLGDEGCWYSDGHGPTYQPAFKVKVVDTTGAGDTFHGAVAYGYAQGWETARTVEFASAVAALKCRRLGGRPGIPTLQEALTFLRSRGGSVWRSPGGSRGRARRRRQCKGV